MTKTDEPQDQAKPAAPVSGYPNIWDILFLILLTCALVCVGYVGVLSHEATKMKSPNKMVKLG